MVSSQNLSLEDAAVSLAKQVDVAVVVVGEDLSDNGEWQDRDTIDLAGTQVKPTLVGSLPVPWRLTRPMPHFRSTS